MPNGDHHVDVYYSYRSPFSYLAAGRLVELSEQGVQVHLRPVYPAAIRNHSFLQNMNPQWPPYSVMLDAPRWAERYGVKWHGQMVFMARPDPIQTEPGAKVGVPLEKQPFIRRLTQLGCAADELGPGRGILFTNKICEAMWTTKDWHKGDVLKKAAATAGVDLDALDAAIQAEPGKFDAIIEKNEKDQHKAGHWGVPLMVYNKEIFFGQDRLDMLLWRLRRNGATLRPFTEAKL